MWGVVQQRDSWRCNQYRCTFNKFSGGDMWRVDRIELRLNSCCSAPLPTLALFLAANLEAQVPMYTVLAMLVYSTVLLC